MQVRALTSFVHGRVDARRGDVVEVNKGEVAELRERGLVEQPADQPEEDFTSLVGAKMDTEVQNKMDEQPVNKARGKK